MYDMTNKIAVNLDIVTNGTYTLKDIESAFRNTSVAKGMTLDVTSGNILFCGKKAGWTNKAKMRRREGDIALLNVLRHSARSMNIKYATTIVNQATYEVLHKKRPLSAHTVCNLVHELQSLQKHAARGQDVLMLHKAKFFLEQDSPALLADALQHVRDPDFTKALAVFRNEALLPAITRSVLEVVTELFEQKNAEELFKKYYATVRNAVNLSEALSGQEQHSHFVGLVSQVALRMVVSALQRAGMGKAFLREFAERMDFSGIKGYFKELHALSRKGYCRDVHPAVMQAASDILDMHQRLRDVLAVGHGERFPLFPLRAMPLNGDYPSKLRELAAEVCNVPAVYKRREASAQMQAAVLQNMLPTVNFDPAAAQESYQVNATFRTDMHRGLHHSDFFVVDAEGGRRQLNFSALEQKLLTEEYRMDQFAEKVARHVCGDDPRAVYVLTSILHQGLYNSVIASLHKPTVQRDMGFYMIPVGFSSHESRRHTTIERWPNGDYTVDTFWRSNVGFVSHVDPVTGNWGEEKACNIAQSHFGMDLKLRLKGTDIAQGLCRPLSESLFVEWGFTLKNE